MADGDAKVRNGRGKSRGSTVKAMTMSQNHHGVILIEKDSKNSTGDSQSKARSSYSQNQRHPQSKKTSAVVATMNSNTISKHSGNVKSATVSQVATNSEYMMLLKREIGDEDNQFMSINNDRHQSPPYDSVSMM